MIACSPRWEPLVCGELPAVELGMPRYNIRKRDGLARTGLFETGTTTIKLPAAADCEELFPTLKEGRYTNMPLPGPATLVGQYPPTAAGRAVTIHPMLDNTAQSGDCVMAAGSAYGVREPAELRGLAGCAQREDAD